MKKIGVLISHYPSESSGILYGAALSYLRYFSKFGQVFLVMPHQKPEDMQLDMLVLPGGPDVSLALQEPGDQYQFGTGKDQPTYTYFIEHMLQQWMEASVPIFGICLGAQVLNVACGGTLTHDAFGHQIQGYHWTFMLPGEIQGVKAPEIMKVNSRHHQMFQEHQLAEDLIPVAFSFEDSDDLNPSKERGAAAVANELHEAYALHLREPGSKEWGYWYPACVEAFYHKELPIAGVQWHPEDMIYGSHLIGDKVSNSLIKWLLNRGDATIGQITPAAPVLQLENA